MNVYLELTEAFNEGRLRAVICSGQAVVLHRLAIMSKDGDWILREDDEALDHILTVLEDRGAVYRYGAPLDLRWMRGGWSAHFEFHCDGIRVRTDFFTRPPRLPAEDLERLWVEQEGRNPPFTNARDLARIKMSQREKDYPVIGELARTMDAPGEQLLYSRSAHDLCLLCAEHPDLARTLAKSRPLIQHAMGDDADPDRVAEALDAERRSLIKADAERMARFENAAAPWRERWPALRREIDGLPLRQAHARLIQEAEADSCLPTTTAPD